MQRGGASLKNTSVTFLIQERRKKRNLLCIPISSVFLCFTFERKIRLKNGSIQNIYSGIHHIKRDYYDATKFVVPLDSRFHFIFTRVSDMYHLAS